jgi:SHS2 domain-containing protein
MKKFYQILDHTADLRIRIVGETLAALFENAGLALAGLICDPDRLTPVETIRIEVAGDDPPDLMVNYLRELLYLWSGEEKLIKHVRVRKIEATTVTSDVTLAEHKPSQHVILNEIKAVTYHQITVEPTDNGWQAMVVFDI